MSNLGISSDPKLVLMKFFLKNIKMSHVTEISLQLNVCVHSGDE